MIIKVDKKLEIHFVDVGQGDACLIITPLNKKILIDGGGSEFGSFNVGEKTLLPYLLDRRINKLDYIIISHFDSDHVRFYSIIIGKQFDSSKNYEEFLKLIKKNKINLYAVEIGRKIKIEEGLYFNVLWPDSKNIISENGINNNSLVFKMEYNKFSILFTGDIEKVAEEAILKKYKEANVLKSTILKVAHHGSKSSSIEEFLEKVKPKIALIGVGEKNTFGHPNVGVLKRLRKNNSKIYRTDLDGEITIITNGNTITIDRFIK